MRAGKLLASRSSLAGSKHITAGLHGVGGRSWRSWQQTWFFRFWSHKVFIVRCVVVAVSRSQQHCFDREVPAWTKDYPYSVGVSQSGCWERKSPRHIVVGKQGGAFAVFNLLLGVPVDRMCSSF